jgi:beta-aspartyl-peptidase (threonine type)
MKKLKYIFISLILYNVEMVSQNTSTFGKNAILVIHGGAGTILRKDMKPEKETAIRMKLNEALQAGNEILKLNGSACDAVQAAIVVLENSPLFNAGKGSVFTADGKNEMDAAIMDGKTGKAGAVAGVKIIKNPIKAAAAVMNQSEHVLLVSGGAEKFAIEKGIETADTAYFYDEYRWNQLQKAKKSNTIILDHDSTGNKKHKTDKHGTVGAVALDKTGNIAAGTSTGGMTNKKFGRVGDSPIIGAGTYANNKTCGISATGHGEYFIRQVLAYDISALIEYKNISLKEAAENVVMQKLVQNGGDGGIIALDRNGNYAMPFNTEGMYRGILFNDGTIKVYIYKDE